MSSKQFYDAQGRPFLPNVGARALSLLNGVKKTVDQFVNAYDLEHGTVKDIVEGKIAPTPDFLEAFDNHPVIRLGELYDKSVRSQFPIKDDTIDGVCITTAAERDATDRKTYRGPEDKKEHFYSYRDTAMSETSLFRPEWISEHYVHDGKNAETPDWAFNKGHFEHQMTYFIGPVNFHWIDNTGKKHVRAMETGDTNYITPFVPHTFSTREKGTGLILAVTYGGAIATDEFQNKIQQLSVKNYLDYAKSIMPEIKGDLTTDKLGGVLIGDHMLVRNIEGNKNVKELMSNIPFQPHQRTLEYTLQKNTPKFANMQRDVERWGYNIGDTRVSLEWKDHSETLSPGDSFFIKSGIKHSFKGRGQLLVVEIKPEGSSASDELALIHKYSGDKGLERIHSENTQWY